MNTKHIYAGNLDAEMKWKFISDTAEARAQAIDDGYTAFSIHSFDYEPEENKNPPMRYGSLWINFDHKKDAIKAVSTVKNFVQDLHLRYGIDPNCLDYYLSGGNGMHVEIPAILFGGCEGHTHLHEIHKFMVPRLLRPRGVPSLQGTIVDESLYCGGKGKLLRAANIKRPDGKYKVPIYFSELMNTDPHKLLELTRSPRTDFSPSKATPTKSSLVYTYEIARNLWSLCRDKSPKVKILEAIQECSFIEHCYQNQDTLSESEWFKMIAVFAQVGDIARPLIHEYSLGYAGYTKEGADQKIDSALNSDDKITCANIKETFDCKRDCGVHYPFDLLMKNKARHEVAINSFVQKEDGVYYRPSSKEHAQDIRICSPLIIHGKLRKADGTGWARLVELTSADGKHKKICIPMRDCTGRGEVVKGLLADHGLEISPIPKCGQLLMEYISYGGENNMFLHAIKTGWHGNNYILPDTIFGSELDEQIYFENTQEGLHNAQGTLEDWQDNVGRLCNGNTLLVFLTCFSLSSPLLLQMKMEGGGLHIYGASSTGKTTCALVAGSVCGGGDKRGYLRQWRSTDNALENTATMHNDNLLVLDEVGQAKAEVVNNVAYMLANGQGRERMRSDSSSQRTRKWQLNFLSTGELGIDDKIEETGKFRAMAGQSVRIIDLPIDKGDGCNLFTETHGYTETAELSNVLSQNCIQFYGTPLRAFMEQYCQNIQEFNERITSYLDAYVETNSPPQSSGQVKRVLRKFALIAVAGELAIEWGILPYQKGDAEAAAKEWFGIWIKQRGSVGDLEVERVLKRIREHFETDKGYYQSDAYVPYDPKGYKCKHNGKDAYLMLSPKIKELFQGVAKTTILKVLQEKGWIALTDNGKVMETKSIFGSNRRGLVFMPSVWEGVEDKPYTPRADVGDYIDLS